MIIFIGAFILLLCVSAPITVALGGCAMIYALIGGTVPITTLVQTIFGGLATFPLLAIPLFMLAGNLMNEGGRTPDLVRFDARWWAHPRRAGACHDPCLRHLRGDLRSRRGHGGSDRRRHDPGHEKTGYGEGVAAALTCPASCLAPASRPAPRS